MGERNVESPNQLTEFRLRTYQTLGQALTAGADLSI